LLAAAGEEANGKIFNLGGNDVISLKELADLLIEVNGEGEYRLRDFPADRRRIDIGDYYADFSLIHSVLGWEPKISLREGLARTLAFYRENLSYYL
jgi:UDP-glucose 4-epimerase